MGTTTRVARQCRVEAEVAAPVEAVWSVVSDVTRTGEWSHECHRVDWLDGVTRAEPGARFRGASTSLWWRWHRNCVVTEVTPGRSITWRTVRSRIYVDSTEWRLVLEPVGEGRTLVVQTFQVVHCPRWWEWVVARFNPPHRDRTEALAADLARIGEVAARDRAGPP